MIEKDAYQMRRISLTDKNWYTFIASALQFCLWISVQHKCVCLNYFYQSTQVHTFSLTVFIENQWVPSIVYILNGQSDYIFF